MGKTTSIAWCDATFNPWIGCTKVSAGCANCYAERMDHRWGNDSWGPGKPRVERVQEISKEDALAEGVCEDFFRSLIEKQR